MKVTELELKGVLRLQFDVFRDDRGYFQEVWNPARANIPGMKKDFVQDNIAFYAAVMSHYIGDAHVPLVADESGRTATKRARIADDLRPTTVGGHDDRRA